MIKKRRLETMDGNTAAAHVSYAYTEVAAIYPITPSSPMADFVDQWSAQGRKNIFGSQVKVQEMQSEAGAAGSVHGSLNAGALTTTYTASQGLLLMIPNMYKIAGELLPCVFHVTARALASHALSIFGDHSDIYSCRQTGFAMLAETNVQEVMDLAPVAHLATIKGRVPFVNFFDGFRTSHELQKIEVWDYEDLADMCDMDAVQAFRDRALNPAHPVARGSHENGDIFFQHREACNSYYDAIPGIVEEYMGKVNEKLGTNYQLFNYYGAEDADRVIVAMGSICDVAEEVIDYLTAQGEKVGLVKVRLYRPFRADKLVAAIPATAKKVAVLDRTKEPGALGEPLYLDVVTALAQSGRMAGLKVTGGRYGLGSKDTPPSSIFAVYEELKKDEPKLQFTLGITDDVTFLSLPEVPAPNTAAEGTVECKFWGLGGDGTVGANKNSIKIIGDHTDKYVQAYFQYDSKKTGGVTISHLRFGDNAIKSPYYINKADFVACHTPAYITKGFPIVRDVKPGGVFMINCQWSDEELAHHLDAASKQYIAKNNIQLYTINAIDLAMQIGMGKRTNTILQSAFFALANVMPQEEAIGYMKKAATKSYLKKGQDVVDLNHKAIDLGASAFHKVEVPADWAEAVDTAAAAEKKGPAAVVKQVTEIMDPVGKMDGDSLPVSTFVDYVDGTFQLGAAAYEKRGVSVMVPEWNADKCIQCNNCSYVCPHATIRAFALTEEEVAGAPENAKVRDFKAGKGKGVYKFALAVSPLDCMGCGVCVSVCPVKALEMVAMESQAAEQPVFDYMVDVVTEKKELDDGTVKGSQFKQPYLEFSGSCAGCAETSYARLITQLYGDHMMISHATIRAFALTEEEVAAAPANAKVRDFKAGKGKGVYKFALAVSPLDCMGCGVCVSVCPVKALEMVAMESQAAEQPVFDYMVEAVTEKKELDDGTVKGSQFKQPYLEFSGSCAGCAETSYARLITQLYGDHMMISNATGCSSIWGNPAATSPYAVNKEGKGPAWANSLFEDNAEHGLGMYLGQKKIREDVKVEVEKIAAEGTNEAVKAAAQAWLDTYNDGNANQESAAALVAALEACDCDCEAKAKVLAKKDYLNKKSCWIFGGDGWAFDIGYGGLDHVIASGEDINIFVFNTEVYSNTGGQASKASNIGQVAQFAAAGKEIKNKSLTEIAMTYGYVYVAQIAMGANMAQTLKAIKEAEAYPGPSLIVAYAPCEMHSIKGGMENCQLEMKKVVETGYWNLFRFNPAAEGDKFTMDSKEPKGGYRELLLNEARYARLTREFPERAERLFEASEANAQARYEHLLKLKELYSK